MCRAGQATVQHEACEFGMKSRRSKGEAEALRSGEEDGGARRWACRTPKDVRAAMWARRCNEFSRCGPKGRVHASVSGARASSATTAGRSHEIPMNLYSECLTFELSGRRRQDARARAEKMYTVPRTGPWWPAVGAPLERGVRRQSCRAACPVHETGFHSQAPCRG